MVHISGAVEERAPGELTWQTVVLGDKISEGANVRTGADSDVELVTDRGHHLQIKASTRITLTSIQDDKTQSLLEEGRVVSDVRHLKKQEQFSIQTPTAVCAVRGTQFETAVHDAGTWVTVYRGVVGLSALSGGSEMAIPAGHMAGIHDGTMEMPRPIASATSAPHAQNRRWPMPPAMKWDWICRAIKSWPRRRLNSARPITGKAKA